MENEIDDLVRRLVRLEEELEKKWEAQRTQFQYQIKGKRAVFEESVIRRHMLLRTGLLTFIRQSPP